MELIREHGGQVYVHPITLEEELLQLWVNTLLYRFRQLKREKRAVRNPLRTNYSLHIVAPNGTNIHGGNIILNVLLYKNSVDVTDEFEPSCFVWTRASKDSYGDLYWNDQHKTGAKSLTITANDVRINADFQCRFEYGDFNIETV